MTREQVIEAVRAHLVDELGVEPDAVKEQTRFREDLDADSLDLYTLLQELEDTHGIKIPDEEAASIETVGQAADMVLAKLGGEQGP
ncbi:MAG: acyl carrier protein [Actinomycetes bacterium]